MTQSARTWPRFLALAALFALSAPALYAASIGEQLSNTTIRDANDAPATLPGLGQKVLAIFYTDPDVSDLNDPFADKLKAANLDKSVYQGIGIADLKDTWLPNSAVRMIVRKKIEKYNATILTDPSHLLSDAWKLGDCNDQSVVIVLDKHATVQFVKKGAMSQAEMDSTFALVQKLMAE